MNRPAPTWHRRRARSSEPAPSIVSLQAGESSANRQAPHPHELKRSSGQRANLDVPEGDGELLVLKPQMSFRKPRVMNVERGLAVQFDDEMIAVRRDLIAIPLIRLERVLARGLRGSDNGAGVVASRLLPPDLHFVAAVFLG